MQSFHLFILELILNEKFTEMILRHSSVHRGLLDWLEQKARGYFNL